MGRFKNDYIEIGYCITKLILACIMIPIGSKHESTAVENSSESCPNGAAYWMKIAGIVLLISSLMNICAKLYKKYAERDGQVDCCEKCLIGMNYFSTACIGVVDLAMLIWGSVVVFGAYSDWTSDDAAKDYYCAYVPMMTAFVILILKWILVPCIIVVSALYYRFFGSEE